MLLVSLTCLLFFFFHHTATTEIYTLSLHDALPISFRLTMVATIFFLVMILFGTIHAALAPNRIMTDRKSTRLNSSHGYISYAVFCLKKKKKKLLNRVSVSSTINSITTRLHNTFVTP